MTVAAVVTHRRPAETAPAVRMLIDVARSAGATLRFDVVETAKHGLVAGPNVEVGGAVAPGADVAICFALGGDGTILSALRRYAGTGVPVFGVNYGEIGFLAAVERDDALDGFRSAFAGAFDRVALPGLQLEVSGVRLEDGPPIAINDIAVERRQGGRVASLAYSVGGDEVGRVRCDGLVVATPAGSTGYNLANGGPVMAWGAAGFVVSFIAPHSLTARALVVAPSDVLSIHNLSTEEAADIAIDGRPIAELAPGADLLTRYVEDRGTLAQMAGSSFYSRLRTKFGRLANS